ncbi:MAG TPA: response regulator transcription factor, partial [Ktedonobacterales bacterium]|nr:response regulator transcription factor [Ktedonobacterales bacterium]
PPLRRERGETRDRRSRVKRRAAEGQRANLPSPAAAGEGPGVGVARVEDTLYVGAIGYPPTTRPTMKALIVEDDADIIRLVQLYLEEAGFGVVSAADGLTGLAAYLREQPDVVILDVMLPGMDGREVCKRIRQVARTPILMLTARRMEDDRVQGLEMGADDYITKPFSPRELVSRVRAVLRRATPESVGGATTTPERPERIIFPGLTILPLAHRVEVAGRPASLTAKEYDLLLTLASAPGHIFSREVLLSRVWGYDYLGDSRTVDVHVGSLRKKVERDPAHPCLIKTIWGVGYSLDPTLTAPDAPTDMPDAEVETGRE